MGDGGHRHARRTGRRRYRARARRARDGTGRAHGRRYRARLAAGLLVTAEAPERRVWLALGGNLGDRIAHLRAALDALIAGGVAIDAVSSVYETPPWGIEDQPRFANI